MTSLIVASTCLLLAVLTPSQGFGAETIPSDEVSDVWPATPPAHPRLFYSTRNMARLKAPGDSPAPSAIREAVLAEAKDLLETEPLERIQIGRRLLSVSREALHRLMHWGFAYRVQPDRAYLERAVREMDAISTFTDWNPSHFLDVAEMTLALAVGYDTFHAALSPGQRGRYRDAIRRLGIQPSFEGKHGWVARDNNWNQVCHGGLLGGAFAIMEDEPELARRVVHRAVNGLPHAMRACAPDGAYPEGPGYWVYGTTYNAVALDLMQGVLGTTFALEETPGFLASADYFLHMTGPSGNWFDYADCSPRRSVTPASGWFARHTGRPELNWNEARLWSTHPKATRFSPLLLLWVPGQAPPPPTDLSYRGRGPNAVAVHRDSWTDPKARFFGIKAGSPMVNHGQMDLGGFVFECDGVRWAIEIGKESYHDIERRGMKLWGRNKGGDRWKIYRNHNRGHNTLMVDGQEQIASARTEITAFTPMPDASTTVDLTPAYARWLQRAERTAAFTERGFRVSDRLHSSGPDRMVTWGFHTRSTVTAQADGSSSLRLEQDDQVMRVSVSPPATWTLRRLDRMEHAWDSPDPTVTCCSFQVSVGSEETEIAVRFDPVDTD